MKIAKISRPIVLSVMAIIGSAFCAESAVTRLSIGTASAGGTFYIIGAGMANILSKELPNVTVTAEQTGGSVENMNLVDSKELDLGMAPTAIAVPAARGQKPFKKKMGITTGWMLYDAPLHLVALKKSGIKTVYDLKGKKLSIGPSGSGANAQTLNVLQAHGISKEDFKPVFIGFDQAGDAVGDGLIDAAAIMGSVPIPAVESLTTLKEVVLIEVDPKVMPQMEGMTGMPYLPTTLPAGTYRGQDRAVILQSAPSYVWIRPDLDPELVYSMTKTVFAHLDELKKIHPTARQFKILSRKDAELLGIPVHPGVVRYAKEIGAWEQ